MKGLMLVGFHNTISAPNFARNQAFTKTETRERLGFRGAFISAFDELKTAI